MERLSWWHVFAFISIVCILIYLAKKTYSKVLIFITGAVLICVAGLRHGYIDTRAYRHGFEELLVSDIFSIDFIKGNEIYDVGFSYLSGIIKMFTENSQAYLFVLSLITVGCIYIGIIKNVKAIDLGVFLMIASGYYLDSMNGVRQCLVSSIMFLVLPKLLINKKLVLYVMVVCVLSTIHASALLFIPLYFIATKKPWSSYTWILILACSLLYIFFNSGVGSFLVDILDGTRYGESYSSLLLEGNTSVNVVRVLIAVIPVALSYLLKKNDEEISKMYTISFNMSVVNLITWFFATKVIYFYRLALYFTPYMILLLCYEVDMIKHVKEKNLIKVSMVLCYLIYFIYSLYIMGDAFFVGYLKY